MNKDKYLRWRMVSGTVKSIAFFGSVIAAVCGYYSTLEVSIASALIVGSWYLLDYVGGRYIKTLESKPSLYVVVRGKDNNND